MTKNGKYVISNQILLVLKYICISTIPFGRVLYSAPEIIGIDVSIVLYHIHQ